MASTHEPQQVIDTAPASVPATTAAPAPASAPASAVVAVPTAAALEEQKQNKLMADMDASLATCTLSSEREASNKHMLALKGNTKPVYFDTGYMRALFPRLSFEGNIVPESKSKYPPVTRDKASFEITLVQGGYELEDVARAMPHMMRRQQHTRRFMFDAGIKALRLVFAKSPALYSATLLGHYAKARDRESVRAATLRGLESLSAAEMGVLEAADPALRERVRAQAEKNWIDGLKYPLLPYDAHDEHGHHASGDRNKSWKRQFQRSVWRVKEYEANKKYSPTHWNELPSTLENWPRIYSEMHELGFRYNPFKLVDASTGRTVPHPMKPVRWLSKESKYTAQQLVLANPLTGAFIMDEKTGDPMRAPAAPGAPLPRIDPRQCPPHVKPVVVPGLLLVHDPSFDPIKFDAFTLVSIAYTVEVVVLGKEENGGYGVRYTPGDTLRVGVTRPYSVQDTQRADFPAGLNSALTALYDTLAANAPLMLEYSMAAAAAAALPPLMLENGGDGEDSNTTAAETRPSAEATAAAAAADAQAREDADMAAAAEAAENTHKRKYEAPLVQEAD